MRYMKAIVFTMFLLVFCSLLTPATAYMKSNSDSRANKKEQAVSQVSVRKETKRKLNISKICVGQTCDLKISGIKKKVKWELKDDNYVATISSKGRITGDDLGKVTVVAKIGKKSITYKIKVVDHKCKAATCTEPSVCVRCNETLEEALGHVCQHEATCTEPQICTRCNEKLQDALGHSYTEATCKKASKCTRCGLVQGSALGHSYTEATCTAPQTCTRCGTTKGDALGHQYDSAHGEIIGTKGNLEGIRCTCTRCSDSVLQPASSASLKTRLMYHSTAGFDGDNASVLLSVYSILDEIITEGMSDEEKVKAIHDYLIYHADYYEGDLDTRPGWSSAVKGVIQNNSGVCNSYTLAFYTMATCEGIPCRYVRGTVTFYGGLIGEHAWNRVYVNGDWYYIDCTWDDSDGGGAENYDYYLSKELWSNHTQKEVQDLAEESEFYWKNYYLCGQGWD